MSVRRRFAVLSIVMVLGLCAAAWGVVSLVSRWAGPTIQTPAATAGGPATATRKIKATLFYLQQDASRLVPMEREVLYGEGTVQQAKRVVEAQLEPAPPSRLTVIPAGTKLRTIYVTDRGEAFVDLSGEISAGHPGGSLNEIFTVYTIVYALTSNLPAISAVQILVDGHEVDTLAGHVDLRRPLPLTRTWLEPAGGAPAASALPGAAPEAVRPQPQPPKPADGRTRP